MVTHQRKNLSSISVLNGWHFTSLSLSASMLSAIDFCSPIEKSVAFELICNRFSFFNHRQQQQKQKQQKHTHTHTPLVSQVAKTQQSGSELNAKLNKILHWLNAIVYLFLLCTVFCAAINNIVYWINAIHSRVRVFPLKCLVIMKLVFATLSLYLFVFHFNITTPSNLRPQIIYKVD